MCTVHIFFLLRFGTSKTGSSSLKQNVLLRVLVEMQSWGSWARQEFYVLKSGKRNTDNVLVLSDPQICFQKANAATLMCKGCRITSVGSNVSVHPVYVLGFTVPLLYVYCTLTVRLLYCTVAYIILL